MMALPWISVVTFLVLSSIYCIVSHQDPEMWFQNLFPPKVCPANASMDTYYGIMFDAGSTGTRIHIYTFVQRSPEKPPELEGEIFESVKPGLSAYADQPWKGAETVRRLLEMAQEAVPPSHWKKTPVVLKATAGLRLLAEHKAQALLSEVRLVFEESPFLVPTDSVSIMDGTYEGILAWITVNFLTGQLYGWNQQTVGTLDLGGASTQITFLPQLEGTLEQTPVDFLTSFEMFNSTYKLYTHSYLGFGLKAARLATLGALEREGPDVSPAAVTGILRGITQKDRVLSVSRLAQSAVSLMFFYSSLNATLCGPDVNLFTTAGYAVYARRAADGQTFRSSCLPKQLEAEWHFGGVKYQYGGNRQGETGFESCYSEVLKVVQGKLHQPDEIRRNSFYAFSYFYDRAVDTDLIDYEKGGVLEVQDFQRKAKEVCDNLERYSSASPFLCMDLCYITALLKEGFGFGDSTILQLAKKVNNIETGWALGATFHLLQSLALSH